MLIDLPPELLDGNEAQAETLLRGYLAVAPHKPGGVAYTGSQFDTWDGGGDRAQVLNAFTDADVNAVAMLSVEIPAHAVIELLLRRGHDLSDLLERIPADVDLHEAPAGTIEEGSAAWQLWDALCAISGIKKVTASKLCARKRPRLLPVYDQYVAPYLGPINTYWAALREELSRDNAALAHRLRRIGDAAAASELSVLRVFDIVTWRSAGN